MTDMQTAVVVLGILWCGAALALTAVQVWKEW